MQTGLYSCGALEGDTDGITVDGGGILVTSGGLNVNGANIVNVATPILGTDAANKAYVDRATGNLLDGSLGSNVLLQSDANGKVEASSIAISGSNVTFPGQIAASSLAASSFVFTDATKTLCRLVKVT